MQRAIKIVIQLTDAFFVHKANTEFLGLISVGDIIIEVFYVLVAMCLEGIAVFVSRYIGAKKIDTACKYVQVMYIIGTIASILLGGIIFFFSPLIVKALFSNLSPSNFDSVIYYLRMAIIFIFFEFYYEGTTSILHVLGKVKVNFTLMLILGFLNTGADLILFNVLKCGIGGAAISTAIAYGVCTVIAIIMLLHYLPELKRVRTKSTEIPKVAGDLVKVGLPIAVGDRAVSLGNTIGKSILCKFAIEHLSLLSVFNKFTTVMLLGVNSTCSTITASLGRCFGANNEEKFKKTFKYIKRLFFGFGFGWATVITIALCFVSRIYGFEGEQLRIMRGLLLLHLVTIYASGYSRYFLAKCLFVREKCTATSVFSILGNIIGRIILPAILCPILTYPIFGLRLGASAEWLACAILTYLYYIYTKRKLKHFI